MIKYFKNRRQRLIKDISNSVRLELQQNYGWREYLPPVVLNNRVVLVTKDGSVSILAEDMLSESYTFTPVRS